MGWKQKLKAWLAGDNLPVKGYIVKDGMQVPLQINEGIIAQYEWQLGRSLSSEEKEVLYQKNTHHYLLLAFFCELYGIDHPFASEYVGKESEYGSLLAALLCDAGCAVVLFPLSSIGIPISNHSRIRYEEVPCNIMVVSNELEIYDDKQIAFVLSLLSEWNDIPLQIYSLRVTDNGLESGTEYESIDKFQEAFKAIQTKQKKIER